MVTYFLQLPPVSKGWQVRMGAYFTLYIKLLVFLKK